jgi:hypothetical protein
MEEFGQHIVNCAKEPCLNPMETLLQKASNVKFRETRKRKVGMQGVLRYICINRMNNNLSFFGR